MKLIGLAGRAGSGKDTAAMSLVKKRLFTPVSFADPLRDLLERINPWIPDPTGGPTQRLKDRLAEHGWDNAKRTFPEIRWALQQLGEGGREILHSSVWIDRAHGLLEQIRLAGSPGAVIRDVRYPNEAEYIQSQGGLVIEIVWTDSPHRLNGSSAGHSSEQVEFDPDYRIHNHTDQPRKMQARLLRLVDALEWNPTPSEIVTGSRRIQDEWSSQQEIAARVQQPQEWSIPTCPDPEIMADDE